MCWGETPIPVWIRLCLASRRASAATSISLRTARVSAQIVGSETAFEISSTEVKSPGLEIGNPASMMSTPRLSSNLATSIFSIVFNWQPGTCSPSRSVVSKMYNLSLIFCRSSDVGRSFDRSESVFSCKKPCVRPYPLGLPLSESALSAAKKPKPAGISAAGPGRMSCISERVNLVARSFVAGVRNGRFGGF